MLWKSGINVYFGALWFKASTLKLVQSSSCKFLGKKKRLQNGQTITYWITMRTVMSFTIGIMHSAKANFFRAFPVWGQWGSESSGLLYSPPYFFILSNSLCPTHFVSINRPCTWSQIRLHWIQPSLPSHQCTQPHAQSIIWGLKPSSSSKSTISQKRRVERNSLSFTFLPTLPPQWQTILGSRVEEVGESNRSRGSPEPDNVSRNGRAGKGRMQTQHHRSHDTKAVLL